MLYNSNLMFTNATLLNDPFDCHLAFRDLSTIPTSVRRGMPGDVFYQIEYQKGLTRRENTYICSLSQVHDSILMWSYYTKQHTGICIGLDMEKTRMYLSRMMGLWLGCAELEVEYRDVINETSSNDVLCYHFATKAKEWQHEQEVRFVAYDPFPTHMRLLPGQDDKDGSIPWKEVRAFLDIGGECFESVYLGVKMNEKDKEKMVKVAKELNPNIRIYQMTINPKVIKLMEQLID